MKVKFKKGDAAYVRCRGFGLVTYESVTVDKVSKNKVYLSHSEYPYDADLGHQISDLPDLGLTISLVVESAEVEKAQAYIKEYEEDCDE